MNNKKMYNLFLVSLVIIVYLLVTLSLYVFQRSLLYHPMENNYSGDKLIVKIEKVKIKKIKIVIAFSLKLNSEEKNKYTITENINIIEVILSFVSIVTAKINNK